MHSGFFMQSFARLLKFEMFDCFLQLADVQEFSSGHSKNKSEKLLQILLKNRQYGMEEPFHRILLYFLQQSIYHMYCVLFTSLKYMYQIEAFPAVVNRLF